MTPIIVDTARRTRAIAATAAVGAMLVVGSIVTGTWTTSSPGQTANVWVSPPGSSFTGCARSATPIAYDASKDCPWTDSSTDAYGVAATGDTVVVKGGSYGNVTMPANRTGSPAVTWNVASSEVVTVGNFENGRITGCTPGGADNQTFNGPIVATLFRSDCADNVTVDGWDVNSQATVAQCFHAESVANFTVRNGQIHNCRAQNTTGSMTYISGNGFLFDNMKIYDALYANPSGGAHTECIYATSVQNLTIRRSHFWSCATMDLFLTGSSTAPNLTIENTIMQKPGGPNNNALAFRSGGAPSPYPTNLVLRHNMIHGYQSPDSTSASSGVVYGNFFKTGGVLCWGSMVCDHNDTSEPDGSFVSPVWTTGGGSTPDTMGDFRPTATSGLINAGDTAKYPSLDLLGFARYIGAAPDIGPYEYGAS